MADPTKYERGYSFSNYQPNKPLPGTEVDIELDDIADAIGGVVDAIKDVRRSDGALKNGIVTADSLAPTLRDDLVNGAISDAEAAAAAAQQSALEASTDAQRAEDAADRIDLGAFDADVAATAAARNAAEAARDGAELAQTGAETARDDAELAEIGAQAAAAQAALYDGPWLDTVAALLADTTLTYTTGQPSTVAAGDIARTRAEGFAYQVAASGASDQHVTTAGGVKLYALPGADGYNHVAAFGLVSGLTDQSGRLSAVLNQLRSFRLPDGDFRIASTVVFPQSPFFGGAHIAGTGAAISNRSTGRAQTSISRLSWLGDAGGTMFRLPGQAGLTVERIAVSGVSNSGAVNTAAVGFQIEAAVGAGSGVSTFRDMSFNDIETAVRCGLAVGDGNCADLTFDRISGAGLGTFLMVENDQGVNYDFRFCSMNFSDRFVWCKRGGNVTMNVGNFAGCGTTNWVFQFDALAANTFCNRISNVRIEQGTRRFVKTTGGSIVIENLTEAQSNQAVRMFDFRGTNATIRNSRLISHNAAAPTFFIDHQSGGFSGMLTVENVHFDVSTWNPLDWLDLGINNLPPVVIFRGCTFGANQRRIADFATDPAYGPVTMTGVTVDTSAVTLSQFGLARAHRSVCKLRRDTIQTFEIYIVARDAANAIIYQGRRLATTRSVADACTLLHSQTIGVDHNPQALSTLPIISVSDSFDCIDVTCTGKTAIGSVAWSASIRECAMVAVA